MGYNTDFNGWFTLSKKLSGKQVEYIRTFSGTRRVKRDVALLHEKYGGEYGLDGDYGIDGEYFAKDDGNFGQTNDGTFTDGCQPDTQPSMWCQWTVGEDNESIVWDGGEKFYHYVEWLKYLIKHFFAKWDILLNGEVKWQGEDMDDCGKITVIDNVVTTIGLQ